MNYLKNAVTREAAECMHVWLMELLCEASKKPLALSTEQYQK